MAAIRDNLPCQEISTAVESKMHEYLKLSHIEYDPTLTLNRRNTLQY